MSSPYEIIKESFNLLSEVPESFKDREIKDFDCLFLMDSNHLLVIRNNYKDFEIFSSGSAECERVNDVSLSPLETIELCFKQIK